MAVKYAQLHHQKPENLPGIIELFTLFHQELFRV